VVDDGRGYLDECDLVVEFAHPSATAKYARGAAEAGRAFLSGTTGLDSAARAALEGASRVVPVFHSPNMSPGVAVLARFAAEAARRLGPGYDVEIIESHHRGKADAPSGTALKLAEAVSEAMGGARLVHGREGRTGPRGRDEIGIHAVRAGEIVGQHTVLLAGPGEWIELTHCALSRACFAEGAVRAVRFLISAPPGLYGMADLPGGPAA
jgi:4-hydroxy-tetrahydrodipicolinate reductase